VIKVVENKPEELSQFFNSTCQAKKAEETKQGFDFYSQTLVSV
jgi:hypothetical protein